MKKTILVINTLFLASLGLISFSAINDDSPHSTYKSKGGPIYNTNAPTEKTCSGKEGTSNCHSGGIPDNSGPATCSIISTGGTMYVPGQTYTITPTINHPTRTRFGFQLSVRRLSNNSNAGNITITDATNTFLHPVSYGNCLTCQFACHKLAGSYFSTTTGQWSMRWTAPATNVGNIRLYACFNASNNNNKETGDEIYFTTLTLTPSSTSVNEAEGFFSLTIFPNPSHDFFNLEMNAKESGKVSVDIFTLDGKIAQHCFDKNISQGGTTEIIYLDGKLQAGVYFIKTSLGDKVSIRKIIITGRQ